MTQQTINIGSAPNDGTGDPLRTSFTKCNSNFTELYTAVSPSSTVTSFNSRVGAITLTALDVTGALTYTPLNKAGDSASGLITFVSGLVSNNISTFTKNAGSLSAIPAAPTGTMARLIQIDGTQTVLDIDSFVNSATPTSTISLRGARGTGAVPTAVVQGDTIAKVSSNGYGATSFQANSNAAMAFVAEGTSSAAFTDLSQPTAIAFSVTPNGSITSAEQMRLTSAGSLQIESGVLSSPGATLLTSLSGALQVVGGMGMSGALHQSGSHAAHTVNANAIAIGSMPTIPSNTLVQVVNSDTNASRVTVDSYLTGSAIGTASSDIIFRMARGTAASPSATQSTDQLGRIVANGYGTSVGAFQPTPTGVIAFVAEGNFSDSSQPTAISFQVTPTSLVTSEQMRLTSNGALNVKGPLALNAPKTVSTTTYTQLATDSSLIFNTSAACTVTLLSPATVPGQILMIKNIAAFAIGSASSNVVLRTNASAQATMLTAVAGQWATLQSDGTNWIVMAGN